MEKKTYYSQKQKFQHFLKKTNKLTVDQDYDQLLTKTNNDQDSTENLTLSIFFGRYYLKSCYYTMINDNMVHIQKLMQKQKL